VKVIKYDYDTRNNVKYEVKYARHFLGTLAKSMGLAAEKDTNTDPFDCRTAVYSKYRFKDDSGTHSVRLRFISANSRLTLLVVQAAPLDTNDDVEWNAFLATLHIKDSFGCAGKAE
jgi:hypothetical protein